MPPPLLRAAMEAWPDTDFMQVYGLTEVSGVATHLLPDEHRDAEAEGHPERLLSAGRAIPGYELRIVDPGTLADLPTGEAGEIWMRTPQLMAGYLNKPDATADVITEDGWFRTGDIGHLDADGFLYVSDRLKDMIISGGENIYSPEVERVLSEHPAVMEVAIVGVPDEKWGESVKAFVALKDGRVRHGRTRSSSTPASGSPTTSAPGPSSSSRRCPATRPARCSSASCGRRTGKGASARSDARYRMR